MITITLALGGLQVVCVALAWMVSPLRPLAYLVCLAWIVACLVVVRHRAWIGGLPPTRAALAVPAALAASGAHQWCLLAGHIFSGLWQAPAIAVFLLQAWLQPLSP